MTPGLASPARAAPPNMHVGIMQPVSSLRAKSFREMEAKVGARALIKNLLPKQSFCLLYGPSGSGKTFLGGHAAICVGTGEDFLGERTRGGPVTYVATENPSSVERRFAGVRDHLPVPDADITLLSGSVNLLDQESTAELMRLLRQTARERSSIALVVIDTTAQAMPGADENTSRDMGGFVSSCLRIRDEFKTCVLAVHHSGKDAAKGARGHSLLRAAVDVELEVSEVDGCRIVTVAKSRDGETGRRLGFALRTILIGRDEDGDPITSCLVEAAATPTGKSGKRRSEPTGKVQKAVLASLKNALSTSGRELPDAPSGVRAVTIGQARDAYYEDVGDIDGKHRSSRFSEAIDGLKAGGFIGSKNDTIWLTDTSHPAGNDGTERSDLSAGGRSVSTGSQVPQILATPAHQDEASEDNARPVEHLPVACDGVLGTLPIREVGADGRPAVLKSKAPSGVNGWRDASTDAKTGCHL